MAVIKALKHIVSRHLPKYTASRHPKKIIMFIDNKTVLKFINFSAYPKYNCTRILVQQILALILDISILFPSHHLTFAKIKSHAGYTGNERILAGISNIWTYTLCPS
eukprot:594579_1